MPEIGEIAPDFTLPRDGGGTVTLSALRPRKVVVYFFPKADTPGCTTESLDFSALIQEFDEAGTTVIGLSKDPLKAQDRFVAKHGLKVIIASDADGETCEEWGVWGEKSMYGKTFMGVTRATFLIDGEGRIARAWPKVKVEGHAEEVLAAAAAL